jgi:hypothetical protein
MGRVRRQQLGFAMLAVVEAVVLAIDFSSGKPGDGLTSALLFCVAAVVFLGVIPAVRTRAEGKRAVPALPARTAATVPAPARRPAWDVSMTLDRAAPWNDVCHYEDASRKPAGIADGVIRVIPRAAERPFWLAAGTPLVTSWTMVTRAPSHGEGIDLLKAAEPLLRERIAELADGRARYFVLKGGALAEVLGCLAPPEAEVVTAGTSMADFAGSVARLTTALGPCAHPGAEPVDLITGERVAWVCPDCEAELPARWRP